MIKTACLLCVFILFSLNSIAQTTSPGSTRSAPGTVPKIEYGTASFYAKKFVGRKTASGELYDANLFTAAHNSLRLGTWIKVTNPKNNRSVIVKVNDRLHHKNKRLVDLSYIAASKLGYVSKGLTRVKVEVLGMKKPEDISL